MANEFEALPLPFVGKFSCTDQPAEVAAAIRQALNLAPGWASQHASWGSAQALLRERIENVGVMLVINGVAGNNSRRSLDAEEFCGFALVDEHAPLIFINNADYKSAQMFTIAHELAHVFVGETGLSALKDFHPTDHAIERFCYLTAAELLIPEGELLTFWDTVARNHNPYPEIAKRFKVSVVVAARRALDLGLVSREDFLAFYEAHAARERRGSVRSTSGGDFWSIQRWRIGRRFAEAVCGAVMEGRLGYRQAYLLTGLRGDTFEQLPDRMGLTT